MSSTVGNDRAGNGGVRFRRHGEGDLAVVFLHGFPDDRHTWDALIPVLTTPGVERVTIGLTGSTDRTAATGPPDRDRFAADVGSVVDALGKRFVVVGRRLGATVAERVAGERPGRAAGLVLVHPPGERSVRFEGPTLVVHDDDAFAGHLDDFLTDVRPSDRRPPSETASPQGWREAFATRSPDAFAMAFAADVVLEASALTRPVEGRDRVKSVMGAASAVYESLVFTRQTVDGPRTYLEWEATAFGGTRLEGVTILTEDEQGLIVRAAIHHRPLGALLRFSAALRDRLDGVVGPEHFHQG
ncbi:alpha/beta fold hydrolase [Streptomyces sp. NPDC091217]|uniref:alpha/beta fold hydrolase n=1 Tax=Streptomyces sp. NPDC091217 TaxID=3365975 RepID=UPI00381E7A58